MIRAIDQESIHRICSSQVVVDLANAVKEMVENALDAQATFIEVKLKSMGADSIEVSDNGRGIDPADYEGIALKHHTSKLRNFEDLFSVDSFGFRGEALNALCELSEKFTITTKRANETTGSMLTFDKFGRYINYLSLLHRLQPNSYSTFTFKTRESHCCTSKHWHNCYCREIV